MTPKEKAAELMANFITETVGMPTLTNKQAKQCALIAVEEILDVIKEEYPSEETNRVIMNWQQVKTEIQNL